MDKLSKLNWLAIGILTVLSMGISMGWYSVFTDSWLEAAGLTQAEAESVGPGAFIVALLGSFITYTTMAYLFRRMQILSAAKGIQMAAIFFIAFVGFEILTGNMFSLRSFNLTLIDGGNVLLHYLVGGIVLGAWQKGETISEAAKDIAEEIR